MYKIKSISKSVVIFISFMLLISSCGKNDKRVSDDRKTDQNVVSAVDTSGAVEGDWVIIRELGDPDKLNIIVQTSAEAQEISSYIYENLNTQDPITYEMIPSIAQLPQISEDHLTFIYKLKKNVTWSDGVPLTGEDAIFTMKAIKNPFVDDAPIRSYYEYVKKIELNDNDPYIIKVTMNRPNWKALYDVGLTPIMPKHVLDPQGLMDRVSWEEMADNKAAAKNPNIQKFADFINSEEVSREPKYVVGTGPYVLEGWKTGQAVTLRRSPSYWDKANTPSYVDKIIFKTIQDNSASVVAAKNKEIDAMFVVAPIDFYKNLENSDQFFLKKAKPTEPGYSYIAWNEVNPLFKDAKVRMALSYLVDRKTMIEKIIFGDAIPIQSPVYVYNKKYLNTDLPEISYDPEKAKQLLSEAGWKMNEKGILEKTLDGKKTEFKFTFLNLNNPVRKQVLLVVIDALKKVGISAELQELEATVFFNKQKKHEFDACYGGWAGTTTPEDPYQIWHSSQVQGEGSNFISFVNAQSDSLIEAYRNEFDEARRIEICKKWQKLIYDQQPYTFLWTPNSRYIYDFRFKDTRWYNKRPSPTYNEWWVPKASQKYSQNSQMN